MRALLLALVALLAAGCMGEGPDVDAACGGLLASPWGEEGGLVRVDVVWRLEREGNLCVQFDDGPVLSRHVEPPLPEPPVLRAGEGRLEGESFRVAAWLAGQNVQASSVFPLTAENHVVVTVDTQGRVSLAKDDKMNELR